MLSSTKEKYAQLQQLLRTARTEAGLSQAEIAQRIAKPQSFVSKYESGERRLDVIELIDVSNALGVDPRKLLDKLTSASA